VARARDRSRSSSRHDRRRRARPRPLEYKLLATFIEHPGKVFSRTDLLQEVWGISPDTNTRTVDTHIRRLRERLGAYSEAIETVHGFGYRLRESA
jgi:two-component system phosphate regulon response regulator PhoB